MDNAEDRSVWVQDTASDFLLLFSVNVTAQFKTRYDLTVQ